MSMKCEKCGKQMRCRDTRSKNNVVRRSYVCSNDHRLYTVEFVREKFKAGSETVDALGQQLVAKQLSDLRFKLHNAIDELIAYDPVEQAPLGVA